MKSSATRAVLLTFLWGVFASCGGDGPSGPPVPVQVILQPARDTITVTGGTLQYSAQVLDKKGKMISGAPLVWSSTVPAVAEIGPSGLATAVSGGVAMIRVSTGVISGQTSLFVYLEPAAASVVAGDGQTGIVGKPLPQGLKVKVLDGAGFPIRGAVVNYAVSEGGGRVFPPFSSTGEDGVGSSQWTLGPSPDELQRVTATVGDVSVEFQATAVWPPAAVTTNSLGNGRLTVEYAEPLSAVGGSGEFFGWSLVGGALPQGLNLSPSGVLGGIPTEEGEFSFTVQVEDSESETATQELALRVCEAPILLAPGEVAVAAPTGLDGCGFFLPSGVAGHRYRVGIVRTEYNRRSRDVVNVTLNVRALGVEPEPLPAPPPLQVAVPLTVPPTLREAEALAGSTEAYHLRIQEEEQELIRSLPPAVGPLPSFPPEAPQVVASRAQAAPEKISLYFAESSCAETTPRPALLLAENEHVAIYQDSVQSETETVSPAAVQAMLDYYRDYGKPVIDLYFGGVSDVNGDGQVVVFVTPGIGVGVAGFVRSSDLLPRTACVSSNEMEITYLKASFINGYNNGSYQQVGTLVHEIKHISSLYKRLVNRDWHPSWIEEGTAEIATDRASRLAIAASGGPGLEAMLTNDDIVTYGPRIEGYNTLLRLRRSLRYIASQPNSVTVNPEDASFWAPAGRQFSHTIYGSGWHFHRWLGDAYGGAATPFADTILFRTQNDSLTQGGPDAYPLLVGRTFPELMEEYAAAVMLNGTGAPLPERPFTSVDFPSAMSSSWVRDPHVRPPGTYPWAVTGAGDTSGTVSMESSDYFGAMGESGLRIHDFTSNGTGRGAEVTVDAPPLSWVVMVRIR